MIKLTLRPVYRKVRRTTVIGFGALSFLLGLGAVQMGWRVGVWAVGLAIIFCFCCYRKRLVVAVPAICAAGLLFGMWRGSDVSAQLGAYADAKEQKLTITGTVANDPSYGNKGQRDFRIENVQLNGRSPPGEVRITTYSMIDAHRGDTVQATGKLNDGFGNYQAAMYFAETRVLTVAQNPFETMRRTFAASLYTNLPATEASLGIGILVGIKTQLPDDLNDQLKLLSLTHIVVASGYNLTILVRMSRRLFEKRSKFQTAVASGGLMASFVMITGFSPSMTRAALVTGLSLLAWYYGRRMHPIVLLLFAAALTAGIEPLMLWGDLGWWLSFLAFAGVLIVAPLLQKRLFGKREPKLIGQLVIETVAAQLTTLPLILALFGAPSLLALLANVIIVPMIPLVMLLTFIGGVAGLVLPVIAGYIALPAAWLLGYVVQVISVLAGAQWAVVPMAITIPIMLAAYATLALICVVLWRVTHHDFMAKSVVE